MAMVFAFLVLSQLLDISNRSKPNHFLERAQIIFLESGFIPVKKFLFICRVCLKFVYFAKNNSLAC